MNDVRDEIHEELKEDGVDFQFEKIGSGRKEWRVSGYLGYIPIKGLFDILRFNMIDPITKMIREHIIIHSKPTATLVVVVNGKYIVLTKQHRPIFGRWFKELVRGWIQSGKPSDIIEPLRRKVPQLFQIGQLDPKDPVHILYGLPEDPGLRDNKKTIAIVNVATNKPVASDAELQEELRKRGRGNLCKALVYTIAEIDQHVLQIMTNPDKKNLGILDCQSMEAWMAYYFHRNPPPTP